MANHNPDILVWENIEIKRSSSEASRRSQDDLRIASAIIDRYQAPPANTSFALEYAYHLLGDANGKSVLDYGCGAGENSVLIASHGGSPIGVDISPELIGLAESRMDVCGMHDYEFKVGSAHELPIDDGSLDIVFGMAILHHLDLELASREVFRVLKKGGRAIFLEPVRNSRLLWFIRRLIPYTSPDVSPYERPLTDAELLDFSREFTLFHARAFSLPFVNLIETLGFDGPLLNFAIRLDGVILRALPFLKHFAAVRVFEITK
ncbi:MAG: class I SAM-dependent methyltransferase [Acidobacteriota bacterium]